MGGLVVHVVAVRDDTLASLWRAVRRRRVRLLTYLDSVAVTCAACVGICVWDC